MRVEIDEQGNVIRAKANCSFLDFVEPVEEAAMKSKFSPTIIDGMPVRIEGELVYSFSIF